MSVRPGVCRPQAFWLFVQQLTQLNTTDGLWRAAAAVSMHTLDGIQLELLDRQFDELAERVRRGSPSGFPKSRLAHLHHVLFDQENFSGDTDNYYSPLNCFLPSVLESRRGLPILLALVYKVVAERVGLCVEGINSPGHFLARVRCDGQWMIVDPFFQGSVLTRDEAIFQLLELTGRANLNESDCLLPATHYQWLSRILTNLQNVFATEGRQTDLAAMTELQKLLWDST